MDSHKNARLTAKGREGMVRGVVDSGLSKAEVARRYNTTPKTVAKWVERFRDEGIEGLRDRSSRPLFATAFIARPNPACHLRSRRGFTPTAPHRRADRPAARHLAGDGEPHPSSPGSQPAVRA